MKNLRIKLLGIILGLIVLLSFGLFSKVFASEEVNVKEVKEKMSYELSSMHLEKYMEHHELAEGMLGSSASELNDIKKSIEDGIKKEGYTVVQITKTKEITDWKPGDNFKTKVGKNWYITIEKKVVLVTKKENYYFDNNYVAITRADGLSNEEDLSIYEGINVFAIAVIHSPAVAITKPESGVSLAVVVIEAQKPTVEVTKVSISGKTELNVGDKTTIQASVTPSNATDKSLTFKSSDTSIATLNQSGALEAKKAGKVTITATATNGVKGTLEVNIKEPRVEVTSVTITGSNEIEKGKNTKLTAKVLPENATDKALKWTSSNAEIATVDNDGKVEAKTPGEVTITATATNGIKKELKMTIKDSASETNTITNTIEPKIPNPDTTSLLKKLFNIIKKVIEKVFEIMRTAFSKL